MGELWSVPLFITLPQFTSEQWVALIGVIVGFFVSFQTGFWNFLGSYYSAKKEKKSTDETKEYNLKDLLQKENTAVQLAEIEDDRTYRQELREDLKVLRSDFRKLNTAYTVQQVRSSEQAGELRYMKLQVEGLERSHGKLKEMLEINSSNLAYTQKQLEETAQNLAETQKQLEETREELHRTAVERDQIRQQLSKRVSELEADVSGYLSQIEQLKGQIERLEHQKGDR